jgi:hypothetical protein
MNIKKLFENEIDKEKIQNLIMQIKASQLATAEKDKRIAELYMQLKNINSDDDDEIISD